MFKVTVVIPIYNAEKFIEKAINSVINQSIGFENIELIIVDDNSDDNSKEILKKYELQYSNIKCIFCENNSGPSRGRNIGINYANSDYVMFLDSDDTYEFEMCEKLYDAVTKYDVNVALCKSRIFERNNIFETYKEFKDYEYLLDPKKNRLIFENSFIWHRIYKISFLKEFDIYFPENIYNEDTYFSFKSFLNSEEVVFINYVGYNYTVRNSKEDSSESHRLSFSQLIKFLNGFEKTWILMKDEYPYVDWLIETHFIFLIHSFVTSNTTFDEKIKYLNELYKLEEKMGWVKFNELWANIVNKNIKNRNFKRVIYLSNILKFVRESDVITRLYRKFYKK